MESGFRAGEDVLIFMGEKPISTGVKRSSCPSRTGNQVHVPLTPKSHHFRLAPPVLRLDQPLVG